MRQRDQKRKVHRTHHCVVVLTSGGRGEKVIISRRLVLSVNVGSWSGHAVVIKRGKMEQCGLLKYHPADRACRVYGALFVGVRAPESDPFRRILQFD